MAAKLAQKTQAASQAEKSRIEDKESLFFFCDEPKSGWRTLEGRQN